MTKTLPQIKALDGHRIHLPVNRKSYIKQVVEMGDLDDYDIEMPKYKSDEIWYHQGIQKLW